MCEKFIILSNCHFLPNRGWPTKGNGDWNQENNHPQRDGRHDKDPHSCTLEVIRFKTCSFTAKMRGKVEQIESQIFKSLVTFFRFSFNCARIPQLQIFKTSAMTWYDLAFRISTGPRLPSPPIRSPAPYVVFLGFQTLGRLFSFAPFWLASVVFKHSDVTPKSPKEEQSADNLFRIRSAKESESRKIREIPGIR